MDEVLTLEKLSEIVDKFPPMPFVAYTMNPRTHSVLKSQTEPHPLTVPWMLGGVEVWVLPRQDEDCIEWHDKERLKAYLKMHGELDDPTTEQADKG